MLTHILPTIQHPRMEIDGLSVCFSHDMHRRGLLEFPLENLFTRVLDIVPRIRTLWVGFIPQTNSHVKTSDFRTTLEAGFLCEVIAGKSFSLLDNLSYLEELQLSHFYWDSTTVMLMKTILQKLSRRTANSRLGKLCLSMCSVDDPDSGPEGDTIHESQGVGSNNGSLQDVGLQRNTREELSPLVVNYFSKCDPFPGITDH